MSKLRIGHKIKGKPTQLSVANQSQHTRRRIGAGEEETNNLEAEQAEVAERT